MPVLRSDMYGDTKYTTVSQCNLGVTYTPAKSLRGEVCKNVKGKHRKRHTSRDIKLSPRSIEIRVYSGTYVASVV